FLRSLPAVRHRPRRAARHDAGQERRTQVPPGGGAVTPEFVADPLEGFEGSLEAVLETLEDGDLRREVEALRDQIAGKRRRTKAREHAKSGDGRFPSRLTPLATLPLRLSAANSSERRSGAPGLLHLTRSR